MPSTIRLQRLCWRIMAPKWAFDPLSGAGAARNGGRYNAPGVAALYLSDDLATASAEYGQDLATRPGTFCAYRLDVAGIVDLSDGPVRASLTLDASFLFSPWKRIALIDKAIPPSWTLSTDLIAQGHAGIRVPSVQRPDGHNIVLWRWNSGPENRVQFLDPNRDLPADQASWPAPDA